MSSSSHAVLVPPLTPPPSSGIIGSRFQSKKENINPQLQSPASPATSTTPNNNAVHSARCTDIAPLKYTPDEDLGQKEKKGVIFSRKNQHHRYPRSPLGLPRAIPPSSTHRSAQPARSILKKPSLQLDLLPAFALLPTPAIQQANPFSDPSSTLAPPTPLHLIPAQRQNRFQTPEPEMDALNCDTLIVSPLKTILASLDMDESLAVLRPVIPSPEPQRPLSSLKPISSIASGLASPPTSSPLHPAQSSSSIPIIQANAQTLLSSTLKDILEAWTTLFGRLRTRFPSEVEDPEALRPIRDNLPKFLDALERDMRRAFVNPVTGESSQTSSPSTSDDESSASSVAADHIGPVAPPKVKRGGLTEFEVTYARDLFMVCSAALKVVSLIFWVPQLWGMIEEDRLRGLVQTVVEILKAPTLPTPNPRKTYTLAAAVLQVQRLPEHILAPHAADISAVLIRGLNGDLGREGKKGATWECLGALQNFADTAHACFRPHMTVLYLALAPLLSPSTTVVLRYKAALAFGAIAKLCLEDEITSLVTAVIDSHTLLTRWLGDAFQKGGSEASLGITVFASVLACCGHATLESKKWMKASLFCLQKGLNNKNDPGIKVACRMLWGIFVYAWADGHKLGLPDFAPDDEYGIIIRQAKFHDVDGDDEPVMTQVCQGALMYHPVGTASVGAFVGDGSDQSGVSIGVQVTMTMLEDGIQYGIELLFRLLAKFDLVPGPDGEMDDTSISVYDSQQLEAGDDPAKAFQWNPKRIVPIPLVNGSLLYSPSVAGASELEMRKYAANAKSALTNDCIRIIDVRPLDAEEIRTHWAYFMKCWRTVVKNGLNISDLDVGKTFGALWGIFLHARLAADVDEEEREELGSQIIDELEFILTHEASVWGHEAVLGNRDERYCRLAVSAHLFQSVMATFKGEHFPPQFHERLLNVLIEAGKELMPVAGNDAPLSEGDLQVRTAWHNYVAAIIIFALQDPYSKILEVIRDGVAADNVSKTPGRREALGSSSSPPSSPSPRSQESSLTAPTAATRSLWFLVWRSMVAQLRKAEVPFERLSVAVEVMPACRWSALEVSYSALIKTAMKRGAAQGFTSARAMQMFLPDIQSATTNPDRALAPLLEVLRLLSSSGTLNDGEESAVLERDLRPLLIATQDLLKEYAPEAGADPDSLTTLLCLEVIDALRELLRDSLPSVLLRRLLTLQDGLLPWLHDASEVLPEEQYNEHIGLFNVDVCGESSRL